MQRPDGKHTVTVILTQQEVDTLRLIMRETYRYTMSDCIRAMINEAGKNFLPPTSPICKNEPNRTKRGAAANQ